jgi:XTP/dITP diphosphohydrolase
MQTNLHNEILIATNNSGKVKEFRQLLIPLKNVSVVTPQELNLALKVEESGSTYAENAWIKADAFCRASGLISLADDSGLEVDQLGGAPGLYSARYSSKPGANDADRRAALLAKLSDLPRPWTARFRASLVLVVPGEQTVHHFSGECGGEIIPEERGENGFGYDPIFLITSVGCTMAELSDQKKNQISHRGRAVEAAIPTLKNILTGYR